MPKPITHQERFAEISTVANADTRLRRLEELAKEPSGKRYTHSRAERERLWTELSELCEDQAKLLANARNHAKAVAIVAEMEQRTIADIPATPPVESQASAATP